MSLLPGPASQRSALETRIVESISKALRRDCELSFYGDEDLVPLEYYERDDAETALVAVEIAPAVERRSREGGLDADGRAMARVALNELMASWTEISSLAAVRERALRLVATHALRAADAMQLAAALVAVSDRPAGHAFVCSDARLRDAAAREGFEVLPGR